MGGGKKPEDIASELATGFAERVPPKLTQEGAHASSFRIANPEISDMLESLGTTLLQEMARFNGLIEALGKTLLMLQKALKGLIVMSQDLDDMCQSFLNNKVPKMWEGKAYPSLRPLASWFEDMLKRVGFIGSWIKKGRPSVYWISSLYFPQGFLTSVLQLYARSNHIAVDVLSFEVIVTDTDDPQEFVEPPEQGIMMYGMYMDGCAWQYASEQGLEEGVITDQQPGIMYIPAPVMHLDPREDYHPPEEKYMCPFYKTSVRAGTLSTTGHSTNFVMHIELETMQLPSYWTLKGAALLSQLND